MSDERHRARGTGRAAAGDRQVQSRPQRPSQRRPDDPHVCARCNSALVYPLEWEQASSDHWRVELRCPECEWTGSGVFSQQVVDGFDVAFDCGTEALLDDLHRLARANIEDEVERFTEALRADLILPEDF